MFINTWLWQEIRIWEMRKEIKIRAFLIVKELFIYLFLIKSLLYGLD